MCLSAQGFTTTRWVHMNEELEPIRRPDERKNAIIVAAVSRWSAWTCLCEREREVEREREGGGGRGGREREREREKERRESI